MWCPCSGRRPSVAPSCRRWSQCRSVAAADSRRCGGSRPCNTSTGRRAAPGSEPDIPVASVADTRLDRTCSSDSRSCSSRPKSSYDRSTGVGVRRWPSDRRLLWASSAPPRSCRERRVAGTSSWSSGSVGACGTRSFPSRASGCWGDLRPPPSIVSSCRVQSWSAVARSASSSRSRRCPGFEIVSRLRRRPRSSSASLCTCILAAVASRVPNNDNMI